MGRPEALTQHAARPLRTPRRRWPSPWRGLLACPWVDGVAPENFRGNQSALPR